MLHKSIRWRIQAWHAVLLICLVTGMLAAFYSYERAEQFRRIDNQLQALLTPLLPRVRPLAGPGFDGLPPEGPERHPALENQREAAEFENGSFYYSAWTREHELIRRSPKGPSIPWPSLKESAIRQYQRSRGEFRELVNFSPDGACVVVGTSTEIARRELAKLAMELIGVGIGLTVFGLAGGWWVAGHALRPIGEISATARQIAGGNRGKRIDIRETESELGQLAEVLNWTFDQQDIALEQQVRFTADASHELRTPVAVILTQVQVALAREREGQEYRETLKSCQRAAERMRTLVNSLLELARVDSGEFQLTVEECDLAAVAADSLELIAPLARERKAVRIKADAARIGQVIVNLLYNAIQHNRDGVEVDLEVSSQGTEAVVRVKDNGSGIAAEALPHVFERFYRGDKSRGGTKNGSGLGLAISQAIVQAHGGTIRAESEAGRGAVFTVNLPRGV